MRIVCSAAEVTVDYYFHSAYMNQKIAPLNNSMDCSFTVSPEPSSVCRVNLDHMGNCTPENGYGYKLSQPCVFLKLNRVGSFLSLFLSSFFFFQIHFYAFLDFQLGSGSI